MVNTFLPFSDFQKVAETLDLKRLGKERVEAKQIIDTIEKGDAAKGWKNHPAVRMWRGYVPALKLYYNTMVKEWVSLKKNNTMKLYDIKEEVVMPWWMGNEDFHRSHQAALVRKYPEFYEEEFPDLPKDYLSKGYVWPKIEEGEQIIEFAPVQKPKK